MAGSQADARGPLGLNHQSQTHQVNIFRFKPLAFGMFFYATVLWP